jgi:hypothetical protein
MRRPSKIRYLRLPEVVGPLVALSLLCASSTKAQERPGYSAGVDADAMV